MLVAVYGSLKKGYGNFSVMERAEGVFICNATTKENNFIMDGYGFPYVIRDNTEKAGKVSVEVYKVTNISPLDGLEGHPTFYKRELLKFENENGHEFEAWMYIYQGNIKANEELKKGDVYIW